MHVLFIEPSFPTYQRQFVRGLAEIGMRVTGIGERPQESLDPELKSWLYGYEQVPTVVDEGTLFQVVRKLQEREWVDRLEATIEAHVMPAAKVREATGIPGTSAETAWLCRDKPAMKEALRKAGVPCAASAGIETAEEAVAFATEVGFPIILKPRSAAGAAGTYRADNASELDMAIRETGLDRGLPVAVEEFIEGHEGFYDSITIGGKTAVDFISHYYPNVLEGMRTRWISPQVATTNRMSEPAYEDVKALGQKVVQALGIGNSATHMEWFYGPKGLKFSEIGCRPTGSHQWDLYSAANDFDVYRQWALAVTHGSLDQQPSRRYSAGMINLRPDRDGKIAGYRGLDKVNQIYGENIIDAHFPPPGTPTQPVDAGFRANAWVRLRHPDYDGLRSMMDDIGRSVKVFAQ